MRDKVRASALQLVAAVDARSLLRRRLAAGVETPPDAWLAALAANLGSQFAGLVRTITFRCEPLCHVVCLGRVMEIPDG